MTKNKKRREKKICALDFIYFDENIFFNILKRLEANTLYKLRVVCKQWYNLIFDPQFANSNLCYAESGILIQTKIGISLKLDFIEMKEGKVKVHDLNVSVRSPVRASCNGLVLVKWHGDFSVVNLLTRKGIKIPLHTDDLPVHRSFGFTYIPQTREYKIVCQMFDISTRSDVFKILTLGSNEWRQVNGPQSNANVRDPISINSFVHLIIFENYLFSIDTANETSHKMKIEHLRARKRYLMDLGGVLSLVRFVGSGAEIWVLDNFYKEHWLLRHCISLEVERFGRKDYLKFAVPIGSLGNGKVVLFADCGSCYVADFELQRVKMLPHIKLDRFLERFHCLPHLHSLISCKSL